MILHHLSNHSTTDSISDPWYVHPIKYEKIEKDDIRKDNCVGVSDTFLNFNHYFFIINTLMNTTITLNNGYKMPIFGLGYFGCYPDLIF